MASRNAGVQAIKEHSETILDSDWDGTTTTVDLDGDKPITGLAFNLSDDATVTFDAVINGVDYSVKSSDGTALSLTLTAADNSYQFITELAGIKTLKITASASQTDAVVTAMEA